MHARYSDHLKDALYARAINAAFGTHYTPADVAAMDDAELSEMLAWIDAQE